MSNLNFNVMKKVVKFLSFAFVGSFLVVASALASGEKSGADVKRSENSVREQLARALSKVSVEDESVAYVYFTVSSKEGFKLEKVSSLNDGLKEAVKSTLSTSSIAVPADLEGKYLIKVNFISK
jgi:hypothetical protein